MTDLLQGEFSPLASHPDCTHREITSYHAKETGEPVAFWACAPETNGRSSNGPARVTTAARTGPATASRPDRSGCQLALRPAYTRPARTAASCF
jgi:hypothetical protein